MSSPTPSAGTHGAALVDLGLDFETYYDSDYTLKKFTTTEYLLDPRFEIIGVGLVSGKQKVWFSGPLDYIRLMLNPLPWHRIRVVAHNAIFDGGILEWKLGIKPAKYMCTMMGVRPYVTPYTGRSDLGSTLKFLDLGEKGTDVQNHVGRKRADFTVEQLASYGEYCKGDALGSLRIAQWLSSKLPEDEQELIDLTIKKFLHPKLHVNTDIIDHHLNRINLSKAALVGALAKCNITAEQIRSRPQFRKLLESKGVAAPLKTSIRTGQLTEAFSKQDAPFLALQNDPKVGWLIEARLALASNMEETRLTRVRAVAKATGGSLPVPLLYYGAHPGRFSGLDKINLQNLPRLKKLPDDTIDPNSGSLRRALVAPPGSTVIAADLAQIEARITAVLAGCVELITAFRENRDVYSAFASEIYGRRITKADLIERFVGKTCILGLGFGMGWGKFHKQMALAKVAMSPKKAADVVYLYRRMYAKIPDLWAMMEFYVNQMRDPRCLEIRGPLTLMHERIVLPNGMPIIYPELDVTPGQGFTFKDRRAYDGETRVHLWGGAVTENVVQALARIILTRAELRLAKAGLRAALQVHDELVFVVRDKKVGIATQAIRLAMEAPVDFLPELPVKVEISHGKSYGEAK